MTNPGSHSDSGGRTETFSAESFFASQPVPATLEEDLKRVEAFLQFQASQGRRVVLITSGGTTVPLEHNVVRFLDNFSAGTRGSASAEHFLRTGDYAVIFMHRQHSLQPFSRHYSHSTHSFLDLMELPGEQQQQQQPVESSSTAATDGLFPPLTGVQPAASATTTSNNNSPQQGSVLLSEPNLTPMRTLLHSYKLVNIMHLLHSLHFTTVQEYLFLLRGVSRLMAQHCGPRALYYLAAAVSDFFIPQQKLSEHKIQSGKGSLTIEMDQVPKILKPLVSEWSQSGYIVSFKLETDDDILIPKASAALERYGHQLVIANSLHKRKHQVALVEPEGVVRWIKLQPEETREIEEDIVRVLRQRHGEWIQNRTTDTHS